MIGFHRWCYFHARWYYKFVSGYAYELNCQVEELRTEIELLQKKLKNQIEVNDLIKSKKLHSLCENPIKEQK
jgi:hypothetical protein